MVLHFVNKFINKWLAFAKKANKMLIVNGLWRVENLESFFCVPKTGCTCIGAARSIRTRALPGASTRVGRVRTLQSNDALWVMKSRDVRNCMIDELMEVWRESTPEVRSRMVADLQEFISRVSPDEPVPPLSRVVLCRKLCDACEIPAWRRVPLPAPAVLPASPGGH